jgi:aspartate racemase
MPTMTQSSHIGIVGGLGVGATVIYYEKITAACAERGIIPRLTITHAHAPSALALVTAGNMKAWPCTWLASPTR